VEVPFQPSSRSSLGIEVELAIVDSTTGELASRAPEVLAELTRLQGGQEHPKVKPELFACTVEIITGVCLSVSEARLDLESTLAELRDVLEPMGLDVIGSGVHPSTVWDTQSYTQGERYLDLLDRLQWPARRLITHGIHYHVGVRSAEKSIAITNATAVYLPMLLALSSSSPFWHGSDTGLASIRTKLMEAMPRTGLPPRLTSWAEFESFMESLINAGSINTIREVWWDIRPHPDFGTIELRMCDAMPTLREIVSLAAFAQSLVERFDQLLDRGYSLPTGRDWILRENKWRAARYGLAAELVVDESGRTRPIANMIEETVDELMPIARRLGCDSELGDVLRILETGTSTDRQRRVLAESGSLADVVTSLRAELATDQPGSPLPRDVRS
jgi:carboxylate-amine ligase